MSTGLEIILSSMPCLVGSGLVLTSGLPITGQSGLLETG